MHNYTKLIALSFSLLLLTLPAFSQDDEDVPEEPMCEASTIKGAIVAYIDSLYSDDDGQDDSLEPESVEDGEDSPSFDSLADALNSMSKARIFFLKNPGVILGSLSKRSIQDLKKLDGINLSDEESINDDDLLEKIYSGDNCVEIKDLLSGYKTSKLKRFNSKSQLKDLIKSAGLIGDLVDGLADAGLIDEETSSELNDSVNSAVAAAKSVLKKARR